MTPQPGRMVFVSAAWLEVVDRVLREADDLQLEVTPLEEVFNPSEYVVSTDTLQRLASAVDEVYNIVREVEE